MVIGYNFIDTLVDMSGQQRLDICEALRCDQSQATFTFVLVDLDGPVWHAMGHWQHPSIEQFAEYLVRVFQVLDWQPDVVLAASCPSWSDLSWQLAAVTVAQRLQLIWPHLPWIWQAPLLAASAAPDWRLPGLGMIAEVFEVARLRGYPSQPIHIVGGKLVQSAAVAAGATFIAPECWHLGHVNKNIVSGL